MWRVEAGEAREENAQGKARILEQWPIRQEDIGSWNQSCQVRDQARSGYRGLHQRKDAFARTVNVQNKGGGWV